MQLCLSHLVDLSLGRPELMKEENFNILHTLLHVILKKLNLCDAPIEITNEHAEKAQGMLNELPKEPSISFKEFTFRNGVKVKKRNPNQLTAKRSIVQINKKWPKFQANICSPPSTPKEKIDSKVILEDLDSLGQRVICLESKLTNFTNQFDAQHRVNCCALEDFEKLKCEFLEFKNNTECVEEEIETDCENEEVDCVEEIRWIKEHMLEFSSSLKIQSECLKELKCTEIPQVGACLEEKIECIEKSLECFKKQNCQEFESLKLNGLNDIKELKSQLECLNCQITCISNQLKELEKTFVENQEMTCDEICTLRIDFMDKLNKATASSSCSRPSRLSSIINTQNLQKNSCNSCNNSCDVSKCSSIKHLNTDEVECTLKLSDCQTFDEQTSQSVCISISQRLCQIQKQVMSQSVCMQQLVRDLACKVDRREFECQCRRINDTIDTLVQLKHDLKSAGAAAGTCAPMSCISCQTSANMTITTSNIPKLPALRCARKPSLHELSSCSFPQSQGSFINSSSWSYCKSDPPRKAGGSHTKSFPDFRRYPAL